MNPTLTVSCAIWLLCTAVNAGNEKALLFHRQKRTVYNITNIEYSEGNCEAYAVACPASESNPTEKKFIDEHSITKKPLLVKKTYEKTDPKNQVELNICDTPFEMSALHNLGNLSVEFGFEVFFESDQRGKYANCVYENYQSIERTTQVMTSSMFNTGLGLLAANAFVERVKKIYEEKFGKQLVFDESWRMKMIWLPMFKLRYSFSKMILFTLTYEIRRNSKWSVTQQRCEDYRLGLEAYNGLSQEVDELYTNQEPIFEKFKPVKKRCAPGDVACELKPPCGSTTRCLEKWSLVPLDQFQLFPDSPLYCSHMVSVPIWTDVAKAALQRLDQYLYALFKVLDTPLRIIAGTSDNLTLPKKKSLLSDVVYVDPKNSKIPTPKVIFKLVKYTLPGCDPKKKDKICEYSVIILIDNDPNFEPKHKICAKGDDIAENWGWNTVTKKDDGTDYGNVYACPDNPTTLTQIFGWFSTTKPKQTLGDLDLTKFPILNENGTISERNIKAEVDKKFLKLLKDGDGNFQSSGFVEVSRGSLTDDEDNFVPADLENRDRIQNETEVKM